MILKNYVWQATNFFTQHEVNEIHRIAEITPLQEGLTGNIDVDPDGNHDETGNKNDEIRQSQVKWFEHQGRFEQLPWLVEKIWEGINLAKQECAWGHSFEYIENLQYTIYNAQPKRKGDFYTWHTDAGDGVYPNGMHRKLSFSIQLSNPDEYEGGHFQWLEPHNEFNKMQSNYKVDLEDSVRSIPFSSKEIGSMIVFPSFLYHQVTPVLKGTRKSLVSWCVGHPYV